MTEMEEEIAKLKKEVTELKGQVSFLMGFAFGSTAKPKK
ncbi:hypothetical protein WFA24289_00233 [Periweissella fabaria]|uniref:Uncharacterized protein n=1 Tax=Periweissella fabaria TaxID=546157 RepID=A0ABM8Z528_9LACO|nr:hypothetical protein WFA24289_00233 [Periweissella fabaria]